MALADELEGELRRNTNLVQELVRRIEIDKLTVRMWIDRTLLYERLDVRQPKAAPPFATSAIEITFGGHNLRTGNEVKVVVEVKDAPPEPDRRMVREVLRAIRWFEDLATGRCATILELAEAEKCCPTLISDRMRLAFLAPDLVEAILGGTQPRELTLASLRRACPLPLSWEEQRKQLLS